MHIWSWPFNTNGWHHTANPTPADWPLKHAPSPPPQVSHHLHHIEPLFITAHKHTGAGWQREWRGKGSHLLCQSAGPRGCSTGGRGGRRQRWLHSRVKEERDLESDSPTVIFFCHLVRSWGLKDTLSNWRNRNWEHDRTENRTALKKINTLITTI